MGRPVASLTSIPRHAGINPVSVVLQSGTAYLPGPASVQAFSRLIDLCHDYFLSCPLSDIIGDLAHCAGKVGGGESCSGHMGAP